MPVTLNWLGDSDHKTRCGGFVSIIGLIFVTMFLIGTFSMYFSFNQVVTQVSVDTLNATLSMNCSAEENTCQFQNATTFTPFVLIMDYNPAGTKVSNLSTVVVPEFYTFQTDQFGNVEYSWFEAVDCIDLYTNIFGSVDNIPKSLKAELEPLRGDRWLCPNLGSEGYILQNDPWTQNVGTNLNFVVNFCSVSAQRQNITDSGCMTNPTEQYQYIDKTRVQHKFVY